MTAETSAKTMIRGLLFLNGHKLYRWGGEPYKTDRYLEELNLNTMQRTSATAGNKEPAVNEQNGPIPKFLCGMVSYGFNELFNFGEFGQKADDISLQTGVDYQWSEVQFMSSRQRSRKMCTNEMYIFNVCWTDHPLVQPSLSQRYIDRHRVLLFAGKQFKQQSNSINIILDMSSWYWSGAITQSINKITAYCSNNPDYVCPPNSTRLEAHFDLESTTTSVVKEQRVLFVWG